MNQFSSKSKVLNVDLNYPQAYKEDYNKALEYYLAKNYSEAKDLVNKGKYDIALKNIAKIKKYDSNYKNINELEIIANCEPLYILAIISNSFVFL